MNPMLQHPPQLFLLLCYNSSKSANCLTLGYGRGWELRDFLKVGILEGRKNKSILGATFLVISRSSLLRTRLDQRVSRQTGKIVPVHIGSLENGRWIGCLHRSFVPCLKSVSLLLARLGACSRGNKWWLPGLVKDPNGKPIEQGRCIYMGILS